LPPLALLEALRFNEGAAAGLVLEGDAPGEPAGGGRFCRGEPTLGSTHFPVEESTSRSMHPGFLSTREERLPESSAA
jgi:hypothetical protein